MNNRDYGDASTSRSYVRSAQRTIRALIILSILSLLVALTTGLVCFIMYKYFTGTDNVSSGKAETAMEQLELEDRTQVAAESPDAEPDYSKEEVDELVSEAREESAQKERKNLLELISRRLKAGDGVMPVLRDLYEDKIVMVDSGAYYFLDRDDSIEKNGLLEDRFVLQDDGTYQYDTDDILCEKGIDVSRFQGTIDWKKVADSGVDFAVIRVGIRGYSEGAIVEDDCFEANLQGAMDAGIKVGVYFFTEAVNEAEALEEADFVLDKLQGRTLDYPVFLDVEDVKSANCRTNNLTSEERTKLVKLFLDRVREEGYRVGVYGNMKSYLLMTDLKQLSAYENWFASYSMPVYYPYKIDILQYSDKGHVAGIKDKVDLNISFTKAVED